MTLKLFSKQNLNLFAFAPKIILKRNLCSGLSAQNVSKDYKYLLILDFEATCDMPRFKNQEIIEFPCLKINLNNFSEEGRFHHYVRPVIRPVLSNFCVELTGILQEMVDEAKTFPEVFKMFQNWREEENLTEENSLYVTSGDWDLRHMLPEQCAYNNLEVPSHMKIWTDIKKLFGHNSGQFYNSFREILNYYDLEFQGRQHSGIDDCLNIFEVVKKMLQSKIKFVPTSKLVDGTINAINLSYNEKIGGLGNQEMGTNVIYGKNFKKKRHIKKTFLKRNVIEQINNFVKNKTV